MSFKKKALKRPNLIIKHFMYSFICLLSLQKILGTLSYNHEHIEILFKMIGSVHPFH